MHTRTTIPQYQESVPSIEPTVKTAHRDRRLGWRQRIRQWCTRCAHAGRRREVPQRLYDLWEPQHEQVWERTADSPRDVVIKESGPGLRFAIYRYLALS
jgi:hypothetical protein